jgi:hypothetical protein
MNKLKSCNMRKTSKGEGSSNYNRCTMAKEQLKK